MPDDAAGGGDAAGLGGRGEADAERRRAFAAIDRELARLERAPPAEVAAIQLKALGRLVLHAAAETRFYPERLAPVLRDGSFDPRHWSEIPILSRQDVRSNGAALRAARTPDTQYGISECRTSGSSGTPVEFAWNRMATVATRGAMERLFRWHGLNLDAPFLELRTFLRYPAGRSGTPRVRWNARGKGVYHEVNAALPLRRQIEALRTVRPQYLLTYPTLARDIALTVAREGGEPVRLDALLTVGEVMTPEIRAICAEAFGARVVDTYGCEEMGKIALQCPVSGLYHVWVPSVMLEVIDDSGRPVGPGEIGRAVVTSLYNYAHPFIRYELGDYVRLASGPCSCGRSLPVIAEILGRRRNMLTLPDGDRRWLSGKVLAAFAKYVPLRQYRLVQTAPERLTLIYVPDGSGRPLDLAGLQAHVRARIHPAMEITVSATEAIPRSKGGKYEDVVGLAA